jgi:GGDEF domain-containing protein
LPAASRLIGSSVIAGAAAMGLHAALMAIFSDAAVSIVNPDGLIASLSTFIITSAALLFTSQRRQQHFMDSANADTNGTQQAPSAKTLSQGETADLHGPYDSAADHHEAMEAALYQRLTTDPVTHLANRRHFLARLDETIAQTQREPDRHIAVITFILSNMVFDALSQGSDQAALPSGSPPALNDPLRALSLEQKNSLKRLAQRCRQSLRPGDLLCRLDGVRFAVLLPNAKPRAAMACAERLREAMALLPLTDDGQTPIPYTVAFGVGTLKAGETSQDLINRCLLTQSMARHSHDGVLFAGSAPPLGATG